MYKTIPIIVMAALCLNFSKKANAQDTKNKAVDVTAKGIQIGQQVPDITITNLHNYKGRNGKSATTAKLSDFKGKLLILDFWATWCGPCAAMIPKMDSLQKQFADKIQFLSVTYQTEKEVLPFLEKYEKQQKKHFNLPLVIGDKQLHQLFPHNVLPHYIWIDGTGTASAITGLKEIETANINRFLEGSHTMEQKKDRYLAYDLEKPLHLNLLNSGAQPEYSSTFTGYTDGFNPVIHIAEIDTKTDTKKGKKVLLINCPLFWIFQTAFRDRGYFGSNRVLLETQNAAKISSRETGKEYSNWLKSGNGYCYELQVSPALRNQIYPIMRSEVKGLFPQFHAQLETRKTMVLALTRTSKADKIKSKGGQFEASFDRDGCRLQNAYLNQLINPLVVTYMQRSPYPIIDQTGYEGKVDLQISGNLSDIESINAAIEQYDLKFIRSEAMIPMLVIRDTQLSESNQPNSSHSK